MMMSWASEELKAEKSIFYFQLHRKSHLNPEKADP